MLVSSVASIGVGGTTLDVVDGKAITVAVGVLRAEQKVFW